MIRKNTLKSAGKSVVSILFAIIWAFPCVWMILSSFKPTSELFSYPLHLFPQEWTMLNFHKALQEFDILQYMGNSVFVAIVATIFTVLFSCMCGFALAKYDSKWLSFFFLCLLSTTMLPTEIMSSVSAAPVYFLTTCATRRML